MKKALKTKTRPLTNYEQNVLLPILMKGLKQKNGKKNAVTSRQIALRLRSHGLRINQRVVATLINYIRTNDLIEGLMASSFGYYITSNEQEYIDYEDTLLGREMAIRDVRMSIRRQRKRIFSQISMISQMQTQIF